MHKPLGTRPGFQVWKHGARPGRDSWLHTHTLISPVGVFAVALGNFGELGPRAAGWMDARVEGQMPVFQPSIALTN